MNFQKKFLVIFILVIIFPLKSLSYEYLNINTNNNIISVSSSLDNIPLINAKHSVVLDRSSKSILCGKNENEKCKMASTTNIVTT